MASWKVLVVDDDPDIRRIAALSLSRLGGLDVRVAASADEALAEVARERPDLVLLDVSMPGMDGPAALAALHKLPGDPVSVVFFTAISSDSEVERLRALGAIGVVAKPFDIADLPRRVRAFLAEIGLE